MDIIISAPQVEGRFIFIERLIGTYLGHTRMAAGSIATQRVSNPHDLIGSPRKIARSIHARGYLVAQEVIIFDGCFVNNAEYVALARKAMEVYRAEVNPAALAIYVERA